MRLTTNVYKILSTQVAKMASIFGEQANSEGSCPGLSQLPLASKQYPFYVGQTFDDYSWVPKEVPNDPE
jgi:hypothetical protein